MFICSMVHCVLRVVVVVVCDRVGGVAGFRCCVFVCWLLVALLLCVFDGLNVHLFYGALCVACCRGCCL